MQTYCILLPDQTGGFGKLRGVMSDLEMFDSSFSNPLLNIDMEEIKKSYVENSVLDTAQQEVLILLVWRYHYKTQKVLKH